MLFARSTAIALLLLAAGIASPAAAQEMFGGFFNKLLPGSSATPQPAPPPATPVVAAKPAAPPPLPENPTETNPFNGGRGGLMDAVNGQEAGCTGVLCNFIGGERAPPAPGQPSMNRTQAELDAIDGAPAPRVRRLPDGSLPPPPEKRCVDTADPWRCYR